MEVVLLKVLESILESELRNQGESTTRKKKVGWGGRGHLHFQNMALVQVRAKKIFKNKS